MNQKASLENTSRREFLQRLSQAIGVAAATSLVAGSGISTALAYTPRPNSADKAGVTFSQAQMKTLQSICATVIPKTDTPSAADVDCHGFVDHQLLQCHSEQDQKRCIDIVDVIDSKTMQSYGKSFAALPTEKQTEILVEVEALRGFSASQKADFKLLKSLIVFGYFTSEDGVKKALFFQPYPGGYKGSIPVDERTKTSGSLDYY
ncbi:gluconate 2-dehydrogenase subunit 3 family protein [Glaciecola sp. 1036]|uniref:gluconate 2-dehydrogenase subunit 3 family protein n=1 Tax=Alteromonadaceae TaxID=72275 RepID=UPI003D070D03